MAAEQQPKLDLAQCKAQTEQGGAQELQASAEQRMTEVELGEGVIRVTAHCIALLKVPSFHIVQLDITSHHLASASLSLLDTG